MSLNNKSKAKLAIILGSGLDVIADSIPEKRLLWSDKSGIHKKRTYIASMNGSSVLIFCGRKHYYEGFPKEQILENIQTAKDFGVTHLLITNAAGGLNADFKESDLMLILSHINFNPKLNLRKTRISYRNAYYDKFKSICNDLKFRIFEGVYGCLPGPAYETPSEIALLKRFGVDAVGMSTIPEVFAASKEGMNIVALSVITNLLNENVIKPLSHNDVLEASRKASAPLKKAIFKLVSELN